MAKYISLDDIKANIANGFELQEYLDETDEIVEDLAEELGVRDPDNISTPLTWTIKRYAINTILMRLCQDKMGTNNVEIGDTEKYLALFGIYNKEADKYKKRISVEMITGNVNEIRDRAYNTGWLFRS